MHPILFQCGPITIYSYGVMLALAVVVCSALMSRDAVKQGIPRESVYDLMFWCVICGILGARVFYVILEWPYFSNNWIEMLMLQKGGLAWQGGFLGGIIAGVSYVRRQKLPLRKMLDLTAPYIALGQAIGRIGCFFNGCCYGKPVSWGVYFPLQNDRLHPTQLYEFAGLFIIFLILKAANARPHVLGRTFVLYLWLAAIERFSVEFFRADHDWTYLGLSLFQYISLGIFVAGLIVLFIFRKSPTK